MSNTKNFLIAAALLTVSTAATAQVSEEKKDTPGAKKEKCFGIVKAGKNDCAAADGTHSCAGLAKNDGGGNEWVLLPSGTCERIVGALTAPKG